MSEHIRRNIIAKDVVPLSTILTKIGVREFAGCFKGKQTEGKDIEEIGMNVMIDIAGIIVSNIPKCTDDLFRWLSSLMDKDVEEVEGLDIDILFEAIIELCQREEFKKVFKLASKLLKLEN